MPCQRGRLVLTFDAFGTLFTPREPIGQSYADTARRHGLSGFTNDQIASTFRDAFKQEQKKAPNYGKQVGMGPPQWWSNVIHATFSPFNPCSALPPKLVSDLLHRFGSSEGYRLYEDVAPLFEELRRAKKTSTVETAAPELTIGVITNSDDRVPSVLSSLGLEVSPRRYGLVADSSDPHSDMEDDIDFVVMSYDVGYEKPSRDVFDAAKQLVRSNCGISGQEDRFVHIGDDLEKDYEGAKRAGWESVLLDRDRIHKVHCSQKAQALSVIRNLRELVPYLRIDQQSR